MTQLPALSYARRSSEQRDNYSLSYQDKANLSCAERESLRVVESIAEDITGTIHLKDRVPSRAEIKRGSVARHGCDAWQMIVSKKIKALIVYRIDRLSRADTADALILIRDILRHGCKIYISSTGRQITDPNDIATIIESWQSGREKDAIVEKLRDGRLEKAKAKWVGAGRPPFGYVKIGTGKDARLEIDKDKAKIVRWIFNRAANTSTTLRGLVEDLNRRGVPASHGGAWRKSGLAVILANEVYCGKFSYGGVAVQDKRLAIIPDHTWHQVQQRLISNREMSPRNTRRQYLMRGRITCYCGGKMGAKSDAGRRAEITWLRYRCYRASDPSAMRCGGIVSAAKIDALAADYIRWAISDDVLRAGIVEHERREVEQLAARSLVDIDSDIAQAERVRNRLYNAFGESGDDADLKAIDNAKSRIADLKSERDKLANAAQMRETNRAVRESIAEHAARLRRHMDQPSFELLNELAGIVEIKARLVRDGAGRAVVFSSAIATERRYSLD